MNTHILYGIVPSFFHQVVVDYIAKNEAGLIFDNSLEKGKPNDVHVTGDPTSSLVIPGARRDPRPSSD